MDRSLYIAMTGAKQSQLAQTINANNMGHAQTAGFKADFQQFRAMPVYGPGYPARVYAMTEVPGTDFTGGGINTTGRDLDVALMDDDGWIAVAGEGGKEAYTRAGDFRVTQDGLLQNGAGEQVVNEGGTPISVPPAQKIDIGRDGTISIIPAGVNATNSAIVDRIKLVKISKNDLVKGRDGLIYRKDGKPQPPDAGVTLHPGALEGSNVNIISSMVEMIELGKHYEFQTKVMKSIDHNAGIGAKLMQMA